MKGPIMKNWIALHTWYLGIRLKCLRRKLHRSIERKMMGRA